MAETIYTIPVNEAFDLSAKEKCRCPFCRLYEKLQQDELELILGASMMEPDVRIKTNEQGFCHRHYGMMFGRGNRLGLGLILESHLNVVREDMKKGAADLIKGPGTKATARIAELRDSCYVCGRISRNFGKMLETAVLLWQRDADFRRKLSAQPFLCLPHFSLYAAEAKARLSKKEYAAFYASLETVVTGYFDGLREDVSWFCKKFDYRYDEEPWGNSKDAVERAIAFLAGGKRGAGVTAENRLRITGACFFHPIRTSRREWE